MSNPSDNAEILTLEASATVESEATDEDPLVPDYNFTEFRVNDSDTNISVTRGGEIAIAGTIIDQNNFDDENSPIYRLYLSKDEQIDLDIESSNDISLVDNDSNKKLQIELKDGEYTFAQNNILIPATIKAGDYYLIAEVNSEQNQPEAELGNNTFTIPTTVTNPTNAAGEPLNKEDIRALQEPIFETNRDSVNYQRPDLDIDGNGSVENSDYTLIDLYVVLGSDAEQFGFFLEDYPDILLGDRATRTTGMQITNYLDGLLV